MKKPAGAGGANSPVVEAAVLAHSGLTRNDLMGYSTSSTPVHWRRILAWLLWHRTVLTFSQTARRMHRSPQGLVNMLRYVDGSSIMQDRANDVCRQQGWNLIECGLAPPSLEDVATACDELLRMSAALCLDTYSPCRTNTEEKPDMTKTMSDEHKRALAIGREDGRTIRRYLEALEDAKAQRGRPVNIDNEREKLAAVNAELAGTLPALDRLRLAQRRIDLEGTITRAEAADEDALPDLERAFVEAAPGYSERKGISYAVWRDAGVPANVLREAGITRG